MSVLKEHITIPKETATGNDLDYAFLRKTGIGHVERMGKALWTDYNVHDPGITMLEMLCYAITDLGNRINMPIENLLTSNDPAKKIDKQFYKASQILPSKPVTSLDYRKLFIDLDGVRNCWLRKFKKKVYVDCKNDVLSYDPDDLNGLMESQKKEFLLKGLYTIIVDYETDDLAERDAIDQKIKTRYHANRNLCEDLIAIEPVKTQPISVCADIEVEAGADEEWIHAQILYQIRQYFATIVRFYSLKQMLNKYTTTEIFEGPILENGFIDTHELIKAELRSEVRLSDIINIIMDIPGVKWIKDITMGNCDDENLPEELICLPEDTKPLLCSKSVFNYNKDVLPLNINSTKVKEYLQEIMAENHAITDEARQDKELEIPQGIYSDPGSYTTIQNDLPDTYGISNIGIPGNPTPERRAKAKQLKGYLLFFDQILASYFKHLQKINEVLAFNGELDKTFFTQKVADLEGLEDLVSDYQLNDDELLTDTLFDVLDNNIERRNAVLDHLIARFAERFTDYTFIMKTLYGSSADEIVLKNKEDFLKDYPEISGCRGAGFNYFHQLPEDLWDTTNVAGVQKRIARLLGILDVNRRDLSSSRVEIYDLLNPDNETVYRWRIRDLDNNIILSSTDDYHDRYLATNELYFAVLQIIQTSKHKIEKAFEDPLSDKTVIDNIRVRKSAGGKFSYDVINPEIENTSHKDYVVARRFTLFNNQELLKQAILDTIKFLKYDFTEEGMFLVEHMLLRPDVTNLDAEKDEFLQVCTDECESCEPLDPYSYRVSIVLPGYTFRFYNTDFRNYAERVIREQLPAHVLAKICWVGYRKGEVPDNENELLTFEEKYKSYLLAKTGLEQEQPKTELKELINALSSMNNVYPSGRLYDCNNEIEEISGKVILGKTNLGSL